MSTVKVYSKMPISVSFAVYDSRTDTDAHNMKITTSRKVSNVTIAGLHEYKRKHQIIAEATDILACTEVPKDLWEQIVSSRGECDPCLVSGQIFVAKSEEEARLKASSSGAMVTDLGNERFYSDKNSAFNNLSMMKV